MPALARQTKYAQNHSGMICVLCDVRGQARRASIQVWSHSKKQTISLPRSLVKIETPDARRWMAISMPRWLMNREGIWFRHSKPMPEFCRQFQTDTRSNEEKADDFEKSLAHTICDQHNRYRRLPDQQAPIYGGDADGGRARRT